MIDSNAKINVYVLIALKGDVNTTSQSTRVLLLLFFFSTNY